MRYFIELSYKGTPFHGWQLQPNGNTVQAELNKALFSLLRERVMTLGAGRTDTGVHARYFVAHFDSQVLATFDCEKIVYQLNAILPAEITVFSIQSVADDANARFDAVSRTYKYFVSLKKSSFTDQYTYRLFKTPDINLMNLCASKLIECKDFTSFSKLHSDVNNNICDVITAHWETNNDDFLVFTIRANRFLRNMVRAIVGTLLDVGHKKISTTDFENLILSKDRSNAGFSAPARGLFLWEIEYPTPMFKSTLLLNKSNGLFL